MKKVFMGSLLVVFLLSVGFVFPTSAFAVDGTILINQASVMAAGGFPYKITQSGSYKLSGNLTVPASTDGIDVMADNVTIDLNGFTIGGPVTCDGNFSFTTTTCTGIGGTGISIFNQNNATVRNGTIRGMGSAIFQQGAGALVEEIHAFNNSGGGIQILTSGVVRRNTVNNNGGAGIFAQSGVISQNVSNGNKGVGIVVNVALVSDNTVYVNGGGGISASSAKVTDNVAGFNSGFGLNVSATLYGSNALVGNTTAVSGSGVSQNNNNCDGASC